MFSANFKPNGNEQLRHRAVSLRQHGFLVFNVVARALNSSMVTGPNLAYRRRSSDPWFDQECRDARRRVRCLERASSRVSRAYYLLLKLPPPVGLLNDVRIASYCSGSAKLSGRQKLTPNVRCQAGCGSQSTRSWTVDKYRYQHQSTPVISISSSTRKSPACALLQPMHRRRSTLLRRLAASCPHSRHSQSMMSSWLFVDCLINSIRRRSNSDASYEGHHHAAGTVHY